MKKNWAWIVGMSKKNKDFDWYGEARRRGIPIPGTRDITGEELKMILDRNYTDNCRMCNATVPKWMRMGGTGGGRSCRYCGEKMWLHHVERPTGHKYPRPEEERRADYDMTTWTRKHNLCPEFRFIRSLPKDERAMMMEFYRGASRDEKEALVQCSLDRELELALVRHRQKFYGQYELGWMGDRGDILVLNEKDRDKWIEMVKTFKEAMRGAYPGARQRYVRKLKAILNDLELDYERIWRGQRDPDEHLPLERRAMIVLAQSATSGGAKVIRHKVIHQVSEPDKLDIGKTFVWSYSSWEKRIFVPVATLARRLKISTDRAGRIYFGKSGSGLGYERARTRIDRDFFSGVIVKPGSEEFEQLRRELGTWQSSGS